MSDPTAPHVNLQTPGKKRWQEPAIVIERPLMVRAQEGTTDGRRLPRVRSNGMISPLGLYSGEDCAPSGA